MNQPILIVGAGPTGLAAALELSRFGLPVRLIDRREAPDSTSRASFVRVSYSVGRTRTMTSRPHRSFISSSVSIILARPCRLK